MSREVRTEVILRHLKSEGYSPDVDDDGDLHLKFEGLNYYVFLDQQDPEFYRICLLNFWSIDDEIERNQVINAAQKATSKTKVAKVFTVRDDTWASIELFLDGPEQMTEVFRRSMTALQSAVRTFREEMQGYQQGLTA
jgi:hypothetical protein